MAKIVLNLNDTDYTLEFNRYALVAMEKRGFNPNMVSERPLTTLTELSHGAFIMHHPNLKDKEIDAIIDEVPDKIAFVNALAGLYKEAVEAMFGEGEKKGNATWGRA